jgi:hypothetical protein
MTVIGFCGAAHCRPEHADVLRGHGAMDAIFDLRDLSTFIDAHLG